MRKTKEELRQICEQNNVDILWSWSRVNTYLTSPYEYFLKYIKHINEDNNNCAYAPLGGMVHDILEEYYEQKIDYNEMLDKYDQGWMINIDIADLKFDRSDKEKNNNIKNRYNLDLQHFFKNHKHIESQKAIEQFILIKLREDIILQGYMDILIKKENNTFVIGDFKTSTIYKGKKALKECGQLVLYAIGLHQMGVPWKNIKIGWNFLKYQNVTVEQKNGKKKVREIERSKLGESLQSNAKTWLKHFGYDPDDYFVQMIQDNSIDCLPKEVKEKFEFDDCWVYVDLTSELFQHWTDLVVNTIDEINLKTKEYKDTKNDKLFWDDEESVKSQSYYFANLCGYSANLLLPYKQYLEKLEKEKNGDVFTGLGEDTNDYVKPINETESNDFDVGTFLMEMLNE